MVLTARLCTARGERKARIVHFPPPSPCCPISLLFVQICGVIPLVCVCTRGLQWTVYMYMQRTRDLLRWSMFGQPSSTAHHRHGLANTRWCSLFDTGVNQNTPFFSLYFQCVPAPRREMPPPSLFLVYIPFSC